jgi:hypothetical protein
MNADMKTLRDEVILFMGVAPTYVEQLGCSSRTHHWVVSTPMFGLLRGSERVGNIDLTQQKLSLGDYEVVVMDDPEHPYWIYIQEIKTASNYIAIKVEIDERDFR